MFVKLLQRLDFYQQWGNDQTPQAVQHGGQRCMSPSSFICLLIVSQFLVFFYSLYKIRVQMYVHLSIQ